jgi:hypothetical protein
MSAVSPGITSPADSPPTRRKSARYPTLEGTLKIEASS